MRLLISILGALVITAPFAFAQDYAETTEGNLIVAGSGCEKIAANESKSSVRMRAADNTAFKALQNLPILSAYRNKSTNFDHKIYELADNYLENLSINTLKQDDNELCVEVNALLPSEAIRVVFADVIDSEPQSNIDSQVDDSFDIDLPPKPQITINEDIAYEETPTSNQKQKINGQAKQIFVDRTEFFDGNSTNKFFDYIKDDLLKIGNIQVIDKPDNPDYVLKTKVLKAKVDKLNAATNRLQVVVALTLVDTKTMENVTEHQNRFILFASEDDAQRTAASLIRNLLASGVRKLSPKIEAGIPDDGKGLIAAPF